MIYDILEVFAREYDEKGDKLILDNYQLKDGLYVKVNKDETLDYFIYQDSKNENVKEYCFKDLNGNIKSTIYQWFKERDYYSRYLNSNKAFNDKKIHNINYLSLFVKLESFTATDSKKKLLPDAIAKQFDTFKSYDKFKKPQEKAILNLFQDKISNQERIEDIEQKYNVITRNIDNIIEIAKENKIGNYIKIFFDEAIEKYIEESSYYYAIKIFNDIAYSENIDGKVYGPSDSNFGLNSKKPFLLSKTKWSSTPPFMITVKNALMLKRFFDWLEGQDYKEHFPLSNDLFFDKSFIKNALTLIDVDYIPNKIDERNNKLPKSIYFKNHLIVKEGKIVIEDNTIDYLWELEEKVDEIFYNRQLKNNYFGEVYKKLDAPFRSLIYMTREAMVNYFKKHDERSFYQVVRKYGSKFILEHIKKNRMFKAALSLNLKMSLLAHKGEMVMDIKAMQIHIIKRLEESSYDALNKEEFFYLAGQVVKYLLNQSEKHEKKGEMLEPYLRANKADKLKHAIQTDYFKYKHKISLHYVKFNNALSLIMSYSGDDKLSLNMDSFLIGALSDNIFYMKKED
ncbi:MAG: hypothetical protein KAI81_00840 [Candidatus Marinimicrobia bacterium]|nr:hypothetical protein [Candidatus Neomarinimicrobiota bacterium]